MEALRFSSSQATNAEKQMQAVIAHLGDTLSLPIEFVSGGSWDTREAALDRGDIQLGWICGLPYVWKADILHPGLELLAAPVLAAPRYGDQPIYYSDIVVLQDGPHSAFEDLRGASWAFNEPHSHSGYNITRYHLATLGERGAFFGKIIQAGSHERALRLILDGSVDASAIDSSVLETEIRNKPELAEQIRVIEALGPSPIPPLVIHLRVPEEMRTALRARLLTLHESEAGRKVLQAGALKRFAAVEGRDYDPIREMEAQAKTVKAWQPSE